MLRADICTIVVGEGANVQDNSVLHAAPGESLVVGRNSTVGHGCVVHCAEVGEQALIGNGSTLLDGAKIGPRTLVAAGSVVTPGTEIPGGMVAAGIPARPTKPIEGTSSEFWVEQNPPYYQELAQRHRRRSARGLASRERPGRGRRAGHDRRRRPARGAQRRRRADRAALAEAFRAFDADDSQSVAVLYGDGRHVLRRRRPQGDRHRARQPGRARRRTTGRWGRPGCGCRSR